MIVSAIAAIGENRALGRDNDLIWRISEDLKRFKSLTTGHPIIMGRKTYESIGRVLPGRLNIIVTRNKDLKIEGATVVQSIDEAIKLAAESGTDETFIIGGGQIYTEALPKTDRLYLTVVKDNKDASVFFPPYEHLFTKKISKEAHTTEDGLSYSFINLER